MDKMTKLDHMSERVKKTGNPKKLNPNTYLGSLESYFELVQNEYRYERDRKQGLETRSGIVLTIVAAMVAIIFDKIPFKDIFSLMMPQLNFIILLKIIAGLLVYFSYIGSVFFAFKTLYTASYAMYNVANISSEKLGNQKNIELGIIITAYRDIIKENRKINEKKAKAFEHAIKLIVICSISVSIYINL